MTTHVRRWLLMLLGIQTLCMARPAAAQVQERTPRFLIATASGFAPLDVSRTAILMRRISPAIEDAPLAEALATIAAQAGVDFTFKVRDLPEGRRIRLEATSITVAAALTEVLLGTYIDVVYGRDGQILLTRRSGLSLIAPRQMGTIMGRVVERGTNVPVASAHVLVTGISGARYTDEEGRYRIPGVPAGEQEVTVKRVGFQATSQRVRVTDGETVTLDLGIARAATILTEVVTTATGERSRLEVGNAIGTIKADSVVPTTLIRNVSDLLQARTPGVVVTNTMGRVGQPSKIRIRGITSLQLNNDPIIVLDGIRLNWITTGSGTSGNKSSILQVNTGSLLLGNSYDAPSRLDDIDPNTIESIDVLRGPSAATLYGTEAANGVIVVKTKKGQAGAWHLNVLADEGQSSYPGVYPAQWRGWGHTATGAIVNNCQGTLVSASRFTSFCQIDSVHVYNGENDPDLTSYGTGTARNLSVNLSGGTTQLQQFLSLRGSDQVGIPKMSAVEQRRITQMWGAPPPDWMVRPNAERDDDGSSRTNIRVGSTLDLQVSAQGIYRNIRAVNGDDAVFFGGAPYLGTWDTLANLQAESMRSKLTGLFKRGFVSTNANYTPRSWLTFNATVGGDYTLRTDDQLQLPSNCTVILAPATGCVSSHTNDRSETFITTMNAGAQASFAPRPWLSLRTSVGENYSGTTFYELLAKNGSGTNLAFGSDLLTPGPVATSGTPQLYNLTESRDERATAGYYVEQTASFQDRLFLTAAVRQDAASAFGANINRKLPAYPKFSLSWLVSDESFFPRKSVISSFRVRAAYGHSGNQARQTDVLPNYQISTVVLDNMNVAGTVLTQIPNPALKPERVTETEGGFDLSLFQNERLHLEATLYRKLSKDAIIENNTPSSYGAIVRTQRLNIGSIENRGVELALTGKLIDTRAVSWDAGINYTQNGNKLVTVNDYVVLNGNSFLVGYPVFGVWDYLPGSWYDRNGDGVLEWNELSTASGTANVPLAAANGRTFVGPPYAVREITYNTGVALLSGRIRLDARFDQNSGQALGADLAGYSQCVAAPATCTLQQQALALSTNGTSLVSLVRFSELSATYTLSSGTARRLLRAHTAAVTFAGRNLALWTNYSWKDPTGSVGNCGTAGNCDASPVGDRGASFGQPINWTLRLNLGF